MSLTTAIKSIVEENSKNLHVAFLAQILIVEGTTAKIQPLGLTRDYGGTAKKQAPITNVPILDSALYRVTPIQVDIVTGIDFDSGTVSREDGGTIGKLTPIKKGDIVLCICCDRNIDAALKGENSLPPAGYHNQSDCVIVSII